MPVIRGPRRDGSLLHEGQIQPAVACVQARDNETPVTGSVRPHNLELPLSVAHLAINCTERGVVPDLLVRGGIRRLLTARLAEIDADSVERGAQRTERFVSAMRDGDRSALDFFTPDEIGDYDGDGLYEILDAWGRPIEFLRWPTGFVTNPDAGKGDVAVTWQTNDSTNRHDPFDPLHVVPSHCPRATFAEPAAQHG